MAQQVKAVKSQPLEFDSWNPCWKRKTSPKSCPLNSVYTPWHVNAWTHINTIHTVIIIITNVSYFLKGEGMGLTLKDSIVFWMVMCEPLNNICFVLRIPLVGTQSAG